ncbi:hypothetical protein PIB30_036096 [Stylosanthes scabra]|uniref:Uncharacterized protein n=1 Tax=Stylosanthes scabra TaxID=79078 RepID=A0ABU6TD17_9FABA|nr:hypothetical protein [Stylosanthes scabra]
MGFHHSPHLNVVEEDKARQPCKARSRLVACCPNVIHIPQNVIKAKQCKPHQSSKSRLVPLSPNVTHHLKAKHSLTKQAQTLRKSCNKSCLVLLKLNVTQKPKTWLAQLWPKFYRVSPSVNGNDTLLISYYLIRSGALAGGSLGVRKDFGHHFASCLLRVVNSPTLRVPASIQSYSRKVHDRAKMANLVTQALGQTRTS